jgi:FtsP/CotA-like multicopper oxidase with cupredoxin domain
MTLRRRNFLHAALGVAAGAVGSWVGSSGAQHRDYGSVPGQPGISSQSRSSFTGVPVPVSVLDVPKVPWKLDGAVKVFRLVAEPIRAEFVPGRLVDVWGYNGHNPGPTIEVNEGDRVRILFENRLPEPTTVHWHGLEVPIEMDGVPVISQPMVAPGERFTYEFTVHQTGTFFYHPHMAMQEMIGLLGFFIIHPKAAYRPVVDKDYGLVLQEWAVLPSNTVPNTLSMEFNWLTFNGKAGPAATPMVVKLGERVRIRLINIGMDHHPIHLHGFQFRVTGTEAGRIPESAWYPQNTVLVGVGQARDIEFEADRPGEWMLHCHLPHHMMNAMVSMVGPMSHGGPMQTGKGMEEGMGVMRGHALSDENAPGFGRGMGMTSMEKPVTSLVGPSPHVQHGTRGEGMGQKRVPGFPQDMFMPMDEEVAKPETYGLPKDWSAALGGMMTLVRVLPPEQYDEIMALVREAGSDTPAAPPSSERRSSPAVGARGHQS